MQKTYATHFTEGSQKTEVLKGVSLKVCAGETTAVVGPSGCGKSTLLYLLGLLDRPESGKIFLNDSEVYLALQIKQELPYVTVRLALFFNFIF